MEQRSEEWFAARLGKVTASKIVDVMARTKAGWGAGRANYMAQLISERLTGEQQSSFSNAAMQWGTDTEPQARAAYTLITGRTVEEVGFVDHPVIEMSGASPDGLVGDSGLVEIKCPNTATHLETLITGAVPTKYRKQMLWQMACTGRAWCDFASFDPRVPFEMQLFVQRVELDPADLAETEAAVREFLAETAAKITELETKYQNKEIAA